jgi:hypothetical protein
MTLPGYVYVPEVITNHIHLGVVPTMAAHLLALALTENHPT